MNVAIVQGRVKGDPDRRTARDGTLLLSFDVSVAVVDGPNQLVPITWAGVEGREPVVEDDLVLTVVGHVHRRFYRSGSQTLSRTDVRAHRVVRGVGRRAAAVMQAALVEHTG